MKYKISELPEKYKNDEKYKDDENSEKLRDVKTVAAIMIDNNSLVIGGSSGYYGDIIFGIFAKDGVDLKSTYEILNEVTKVYLNNITKYDNVIYHQKINHVPYIHIFTDQEIGDILVTATKNIVKSSGRDIFCNIEFEINDFEPINDGILFYQGINHF